MSKTNSKNSKNSNAKYRSSYRPALAAVASVAVLGLALVGCGQKDGGTKAGAKDEHKQEAAASGNGAKVLWVGDSIAAAEAPAIGAALKASDVEFKDASSDGGGTVVAGSEKITQMIAGDTWKQLTENIKTFKPTVIAYQVTTYDWGTADQQRAAYEKLVRAAKDAKAKVAFVSSPPIKIDDFYKPHAPQMRTAPKAAEEVAKKSGGTATYLDSSQLWGTDRSAKQAQRGPDGIHNCQQGAAAFAKWFGEELGKSEGFKPAPVDKWAKSGWTGSDRYGKLKCES
ncbi:SGNH hydrolase domain-containing protein [Streptomyces sp. NPDC057654]|uniref:SGNH hydrolase domain-containing protein n=1 Tax=Streptomyces sp. NPDC057654 TaxID=3346196 RepID=UPI0036C1D16B